MHSICVYAYCVFKFFFIMLKKFDDLTSIGNFTQMLVDGIVGELVGCVKYKGIHFYWVQAMIDKNIFAVKCRIFHFSTYLLCDRINKSRKRTQKRVWRSLLKYFCFKTYKFNYLICLLQNQLTAGGIAIHSCMLYSQKLI